MENLIHRINNFRDSLNQIKQDYKHGLFFKCIPVLYKKGTCMDNVAENLGYDGG